MTDNLSVQLKYTLFTVLQHKGKGIVHILLIDCGAPFGQLCKLHKNLFRLLYVRRFPHNLHALAPCDQCNVKRPFYLLRKNIKLAEHICLMLSRNVDDCLHQSHPLFSCLVLFFDYRNLQ